MNGEDEPLIELDEILVDTADTEPRGRAGTSRRAIAAVGAVAVVAAALGGGYAMGRSVAGDGAAGSAEIEPAESEQAESEPAAPEPAATFADEPAPATTVLLGQGTAEIAADDADFSASGRGGWSMFGIGPMDLLVERTLPDGTTLRAQLGETWDQGYSDWGYGDWRPAAWCFESGQMRIAAAGNGMIDVGWAPWYREPYQGRSVSWVGLGGPDDAPILVVVVQAPADTASVTVTFPDGATDTTTPHNGYALLAVPGQHDPEPVDDDGYYDGSPPSFEVTFEGGSAAGVVSSDGVGAWNDPAYREACQPPPPALPDPGEQPADADAARERITTMMTQMYDQTDTGEAEDFLDDATGVAEARQQVADGSFGETAASAQAFVEELVFTSPTEAWFRYRIETNNGTFGDRFGIAVVVDGEWRITRNTICQDLSMAGGDCGGGWTPIYPPSMGDMMIEPAVIVD